MMFDASQHRIEACSNTAWDDDPSWVVICACGWETWGSDEEWIARDDHLDHMVEEFKNWLRVAPHA